MAFDFFSENALSAVAIELDCWIGTNTELGREFIMKLSGLAFGLSRFDVDFLAL